MTELNESRLGWLFGVLGAGVFALAGILSLMVWVADLALGRGMASLNAGGYAILAFVVAGLAFLFAYLGHKAWSQRPLTTGILLVVVAAIGWVTLVGAGLSVVPLLGAILVFLAGVLILVSPAVQGLKTLATA